MPSKRRQLNVRLDDEWWGRLDRLSERVRAETGVDLTQAQIIVAALKSLEEKYPEPKKGKK